VSAVPHPAADDRPFAVVDIGSNSGRMIVFRLREGEHLDVLEDCGLARTEKIGRVRTCRFETKGLAVLEQWIRDQRALWEERLDRLGDLLEED